MEPDNKATQPPVVVALPNLSSQKMAAIVKLSEAVASLASALASAHVDVEISSCSFSECETGVKVIGQPTDTKISDSKFSGEDPRRDH